jgi:hypothetical protein
MRTPTRKPSPSAAHCSGGLVMSISTLTRCSSTPERRHLGEGRRLDAAHAALQHARAAPALDAHQAAGLRAAARRRSAARPPPRAAPCRRARSAARPAPPRPRWPGAPSARGRPPARAARRRARAPPAAAHRAQRGARLLQLVAAMWPSSTAASSSFCAACTARRSVSSLVGATKPCCASCSLRCRSLRAALQRHRAPSMRAGARCTLGLCGLDARCCSRGVRSSSSGGSTGVSAPARRPPDRVALAQRDARQPPGQRCRDHVAVGAGGSCRPRRSWSRRGPR